MNTSEQINELAAALAQAQGEMSGAVKDSTNPFFKSKYADLASVRAACLPALAKRGICVVQSPSTVGFTVVVETRLLHSSGQWIAGVVSAVAKDESPQAIGSTITYLRRYALQSFAGVAPEDDDAEAAQGRGSTSPVQAVAPKGYREWLEGLADVIPEGLKALEAAWKASPAPFRQHLTTTDPKGWDAMKATAGKMSANHAPRLV